MSSTLSMKDVASELELWLTAAKKAYSTNVPSTSLFSTRMILVSGPRGCGKSTLVARALEWWKKGGEGHEESHRGGVLVSANTLLVRARQGLSPATLFEDTLGVARLSAPSEVGKQGTEARGPCCGVPPYLVIIDDLDRLLLLNAFSGAESLGGQESGVTSSSSSSNSSSSRNGVTGTRGSHSLGALFSVLVNWLSQNSQIVVVAACSSDILSGHGNDGQLRSSEADLVDDGAKAYARTQELLRTTFRVHLRIALPSDDERLSLLTSLIPSSSSSAGSCVGFSPDFDGGGGGGDGGGCGSAAAAAATVTTTHTEVLQTLAKKTSGFNYGELVKLARTYCLVLEGPGTEWVAVDYVLSRVRSSFLEAVSASVPRLDWGHVGGYVEVKEALEQVLEWPTKYRATQERLGLPTNSGVLLHGPSGCGKSRLALALAGQCGVPLLALRGSSLASMYLGESERLVRRAFSLAATLPSVVLFIDELDILCASRDTNETETDGGVGQRVLSSLLNEIDGVSSRKGITLVACTSSPERVDSALLRPGRLDRHVFVGLPRAADRAEILSSVLFKEFVVGGDVDVTTLVQATEGWTGGALRELCRLAGLAAIREAPSNATSIEARHFTTALARLQSQSQSTAS